MCSLRRDLLTSSCKFTIDALLASPLPALLIYLCIFSTHYSGSHLIDVPSMFAPLTWIEFKRSQMKSSWDLFCLLIWTWYLPFAPSESCSTILCPTSWHRRLTGMACIKRHSCLKFLGGAGQRELPVRVGREGGEWTWSIYSPSALPEWFPCTGYVPNKDRALVSPFPQSQVLSSGASNCSLLAPSCLRGATAPHCG